MRPEDKKTTERNQENRNPSQQQNRDISRDRTGYDAKKDVKGAQVKGSEQRGQSQGREKDFAKERDQSKGNRPFNK